MSTAKFLFEIMYVTKMTADNDSVMFTING